MERQAGKVSEPVKILGLSGSLRRGSLNRALLRAAAELAPPGVEFQVFDLSRLPIYNQDLEVEGPPRSARAFRLALEEADGVLIATPEYNHTTSSAVKNAVEWGSRPHGDSPLMGKPVAIMGASPGRSGTARAQAALREMLAEPGAVVVEQPELLVAGASRKFDADRRLVDAETEVSLRDLLDALLELIARVGPSSRSRARERLRRVS